MLRNFLFNVRMSFRMWARNRTRPFTVEEAEEKKLFWAKIYMLCACAAFLIVSRSTLMGESSENFSKSLPIAKKFINDMDDKSKLRVIKFSGFTKTSDVLITKEQAYQMKEAENNASKSNLEKST